MLVFKKNGTYGSLSWQGNHPKKFKLDDISTLNQVSIGDTIITGGMSDYFPYGIPIGIVSKVIRPEFEGYYDIEIELLVILLKRNLFTLLKTKI